MKMEPDYKKIYQDMVILKFPEKKESCNRILKKNKLSSLDILTLNNIIFGHQEDNQRFKSYDVKTIKEILHWQKKYGATNLALAHEFKLSRNTVTKWKRMFPEFGK